MSSPPPHRPTTPPPRHTITHGAVHIATDDSLLNLKSGDTLTLELDMDAIEEIQETMTNCFAALKAENTALKAENK